jgi:hypothetical protein
MLNLAADEWRYQAGPKISDMRIAHDRDAAEIVDVT